MYKNENVSWGFLQPDCNSFNICDEERHNTVFVVQHSQLSHLKQKQMLIFIIFRIKKMLVWPEPDFFDNKSFEHDFVLTLTFCHLSDVFASHLFYALNIIIRQLFLFCFVVSVTSFFRFELYSISYTSSLSESRLM